MNALSDFLQLWTKLNLAKSYTFNNFADSGSKDKRKGRSLEAQKSNGGLNDVRENILFILIYSTQVAQLPISTLADKLL